MQINWNSQTLLVECKMVQLLRKTVWQFLTKLNIHLGDHMTQQFHCWVFTQEKLKQCSHTELYQYVNVHNSFIHHHTHKKNCKQYIHP